MRRYDNVDIVLTKNDCMKLLQAILKHPPTEFNTKDDESDFECTMETTSDGTVFHFNKLEIDLKE